MATMDGSGTRNLHHYFVKAQKGRNIHFNPILHRIFKKPKEQGFRYRPNASLIGSGRIVQLLVACVLLHLRWRAPPRSKPKRGLMLLFRDIAHTKNQADLLLLCILHSSSDPQQSNRLCDLAIKNLFLLSGNYQRCYLFGHSFTTNITILLYNFCGILKFNFDALICKKYACKLCCKLRLILWLGGWKISKFLLII